MGSDHWVFFSSGGLISSAASGSHYGMIAFGLMSVASIIIWACGD